VYFEDYSPEELVEILKQFCQKGHYVLSAEAEDKLRGVVQSICSTRDKSFGNAREMRNLFQRMQESLSLRISQKDDVSTKELCTFLAEDIPQTDSSPERKQNKLQVVGRKLLSFNCLPTSFPGSPEGEQESEMGNATRMLDRIIPAVAYIEVVETGGTEASGSGFVITPDGKLITCFHVVEDAKEIRVRFDTDVKRWFTARFFDGDQAADIAVLQLEGEGFPYTLLASPGGDINIGEEVGLLGYPLGEELGFRVSYTAGVVSSFRQAEHGIRFIQIDANAYHGSSGGPLFRHKDGRVIGILHGGLKQEKAVMINFAVDIQEVYKRLTAEK
jgi:S1-C subfamily serine protease